jgi:hypothetical protein
MDFPPSIRRQVASRVMRVLPVSRLRLQQVPGHDLGVSKINELEEHVQADHQADVLAPSF